MWSALRSCVACVQRASVFTRLASGGPRKPVIGAKREIAGVKHVVAVASGKGGVGKSTLSVNLALGLYKQGFAVGLLDADIYGPSIPLMMNLQGKSPIKQDNLLVPLENFGLRVISMGMLTDPESPMIWRGPMVGSAVDQLLHKVKWGLLDFLVIDLPPGTGDAQLTLVQNVQLTGAVIISTPQDVALADARRGANMFRHVDVPIIGLVENMSYYVCPCCNTKTHIFGDSGAKKTAEKMGIEFLGEVPLLTNIREGADQGQPVVISQPESDAAKAFDAIAKRVAEKVESGEMQTATAPLPKISVV